MNVQPQGHGLPEGNEFKIGSHQKWAGAQNPNTPSGSPPMPLKAPQGTSGSSSRLNPSGGYYVRNAIIGRPSSSAKLKKGNSEGVRQAMQDILSKSQLNAALQGLQSLASPLK